jgi:hypothetical protein
MKAQLLPSVERRRLMPSDDPDGRREFDLRFDKEMTNDQGTMTS